MPTPDTRKPYSGLTRSLVIAIDIGTTFSGVSYAILEPALVPKIYGVTRYFSRSLPSIHFTALRFPGQEHVAGNTKIPSVIYYDRHGKIMAAGAEADDVTIQAQADDEAWIKAELCAHTLMRLLPLTQISVSNFVSAPAPCAST